MYFVEFTVIVCSMINCTQESCSMLCVIYFGATVVTIFVLMIMVSLMQLPSIYGYRSLILPWTYDHSNVFCTYGNNKSTVIVLDLRI